MSKGLLFPGSAIVLLLAAGGCCTTGDYDPREGGFAGGACGVATGAYDARIASRERSIQDLQSIEDDLLASIDSDLDETAMLDRRIANLQDRYDRFAAKLATLRDKYAEEDELRLKIFELQQEAQRVEQYMGRMPRTELEQPEYDPAPAQAVLMVEEPSLPSLTSEEVEDAEAYLDALEAKTAEVLGEPIT